MADSQLQHSSGQVIIFATGYAADRPEYDKFGPGGWGAVLIYGEHTREICGSETQTTRYRMELTAVAQALECLTRPSHVKVRLIGEREEGALFIRDGLRVSERPGHRTPKDAAGEEEEIELWRRLAAMEELHTIEWEDPWEDDLERFRDGPRKIPVDPPGNALSDPEDRAFALARQQFEIVKLGIRENSIDAALDRYTDVRELECSERKLSEIRGVISSLSWSINHSCDWKSAEIPAEQILDHMRGLSTDLVHHMFPSLTHLQEIRRVVPDIIKWLQAQGRLDRAEAQSAIEDVKAEIGGLISIRKFVDSLDAYLNETSRAYDDPTNDRDAVDDEYLEIRDVSDDSISFTHVHWVTGARRVVGPIKIPPKIAKLATRGWFICVSAACVDGEWQLIEVSNGDIYPWGPC